VASRLANDELRARWAARHPGYDVGDGLLSRWTHTMWRLARPLAAARVSPDAVTIVGTALALGSARSRPGRASALLIASSVADGLDGAVAILSGSWTAHGTALDHASDRVGDIAAGIVLRRAGAPRMLVVPAVALSLAQEILRVRRDPVITVNERPTRIVCAAAGDIGRRVAGRRWPAIVSALVWDGLAAVAALQLAAKARVGNPLESVAEADHSAFQHRTRSSVMRRRSQRLDKQEQQHRDHRQHDHGD
jgi:phosphatidylglycerophosphate synthase